MKYTDLCKYCWRSTGIPSDCRRSAGPRSQRLYQTVGDQDSVCVYMYIHRDNKIKIMHCLQFCTLSDSAVFELETSGLGGIELETADFCKSTIISK